MPRVDHTECDAVKCPDCGAMADATLIDAGDPWCDGDTWFVCCSCGRQTDVVDGPCYATKEDAIAAFLDDSEAVRDPE